MSLGENCWNEVPRGCGQRPAVMPWRQRSGHYWGVTILPARQVRRLVRGQSEEIRIGYLASVFDEYLEPALKKLRKIHPQAKVKLLDLFPGEQLAALRNGEIDVGLTLETGGAAGPRLLHAKIGHWQERCLSTSETSVGVAKGIEACRS